MLNYKQLYYFWSVAKYGGITKAAAQLHLTPQTISGQLSELEQKADFKLFDRVGKRLELSAEGKLAFAYADEIFQVGKELEALFRSKNRPKSLNFKVGISDVVPKTVAYRLLSPTRSMEQHVTMLCTEDKPANLFSSLALHQLDLVIADKPLTELKGIRVFNHLLSESSLAFYASEELADSISTDFPKLLETTPMLLPSSDSALRMNLERWLSENGIYPVVVGEFDDSALMKVFGQEGSGIFPAPYAIADELAKQYGLVMIGELEDVRIRYYAISADRKLKHPAVVAISEAANQ